MGSIPRVHRFPIDMVVSLGQSHYPMMWRDQGGEVFAKLGPIRIDSIGGSDVEGLQPKYSNPGLDSMRLTSAELVQEAVVEPSVSELWRLHLEAGEVEVSGTHLDFGTYVESGSHVIPGFPPIARLLADHYRTTAFPLNVLRVQTELRSEIPLETLLKGIEPTMPGVALLVDVRVPVGNKRDDYEKMRGRLHLECGIEIDEIDGFGYVGYVDYALAFFSDPLGVLCTEAFNLECPYWPEEAGQAAKDQGIPALVVGQPTVSNPAGGTSTGVLGKYWAGNEEAFIVAPVRSCGKIPENATWNMIEINPYFLDKVLAEEIPICGLPCAPVVYARVD